MGLKTYQKGPGTLNYAIIRKQTSKATILSFFKTKPPGLISRTVLDINKKCNDVFE